MTAKDLAELSSRFKILEIEVIEEAPSGASAPAKKPKRYPATRMSSDTLIEKGSTAKARTASEHCVVKAIALFNAPVKRSVLDARVKEVFKSRGLAASGSGPAISQAVKRGIIHALPRKEK
jgi:hypothetical protein